jgi:hypothetical protein
MRYIPADNNVFNVPYLTAFMRELELDEDAAAAYNVPRFIFHNNRPTIVALAAQSELQHIHHWHKIHGVLKCNWHKIHGVLKCNSQMCRKNGVLKSASQT